MSRAPELVFRGRRVVTPGGERAAAVHVRDGVITAVAGYDDVPPGTRLVDAGAAVLLPGLVDTHVHINEPGRTEWEGFASATLAAAAGGVTTLVDMPLNSVPSTTSVDALEAKRRAAAAGACRVDVAFWGGLVQGNLGDLEPLAEAGVTGFKCFLAPSGVDEFGHVGAAEIEAALPILRRLGLPLLAHAESAERLAAAEPDPSADPRRYPTYLRSRPDDAEAEAAELLLELCTRAGTRVHIVHVSSELVLPVLRRARSAGTPLTAETCPHYLYFAADEVPPGATEYKCAPPLRSGGNRERLWEGLARGDLAMVVTDHSPAPPELKLGAAGDFMRAWGGIGSLELGLSVVWEGARTRDHGPSALAEWMAAAPARLAGLAARKGAIATGRDADLVVWRPDAEYRVEPERLRQRHKLTPYAGRVLPGVVEATYLRGLPAYADGEPVGPARGQLLTGVKAEWNT